MEEVKNEGLEVVAWLCSWIAGSYGGMHAGLSETSLDGLRKDRGDDIQIITDEPLCRHSEALAGYAVRDAQIAELEFELEVAKTDELSAAVWAATETIKHELWDAQAELAAIKAQEPVAWEVYYSDDDSFHTITRDKELIECYSKMAYTIKPLYAAPVAKQVVLPDADHSEDVRTMVLPDRSDVHTSSQPIG